MKKMPMKKHEKIHMKNIVYVEYFVQLFYHG